MNTPVNCFTCGTIFHQYNLTQKYCSAACRNKARYARLKDQLTKSHLPLIAEQLTRSQERVKDLEARIKDLKQLEQENEALRITIQQLENKPMPFLYRIELRKISITQTLEQPYVDFYLDNHGNKTIDMDTMYLIIYSDDGILLSEQEIKRSEELTYFMDYNNITDIDLMPCGRKSLMRS